MLWRALLLAVGVFAGSTAVIQIKACTVDPVQMASYRQLVAAAVLAPVFLRDWRRHRAAYTWAHLRGAMLPGLMLGLHFISWIFGAQKARAANASLIVNMVPIVLPFFLHWLIRERITKGEVAGTALALAGLVLLAVADSRHGGQLVAGDLICFGSMILFALYLALGRKNRHYPTVWLYLVPVYFLGGAFCLLCTLVLAPIAPALAAPITAFPTQNVLREVLLVLGLGIIPTVIGHSILNYTMRHLRGQVVGIANLGQFVFAGVMAWFFFQEVPSWALYVSAVFVVAGVAIAVRSAPPAAREPPPLPDEPG